MMLAGFLGWALLTLAAIGTLYTVAALIVFRSARRRVRDFGGTPAK